MNNALHVGQQLVKMTKNRVCIKKGFPAQNAQILHQIKRKRGLKRELDRWKLQEKKGSNIWEVNHFQP